MGWGSARDARQATRTIAVAVIWAVGIVTGVALRRAGWTDDTVSSARLVPWRRGERRGLSSTNRTVIMTTIITAVITVVGTVWLTKLLG